MIQSRFYNPLLTADEKVLLISDRHWIKRLPAHYAMCVGVTLACLVLYLWLRTNEWWTVLTTILLVIWAIGIIVSYFFAWSYILQRRGLVLTNHRLLQFKHDILTRAHLVIPYNNIEESTIKENFFSNLFGYGDWHLVVHENKERISFKSYQHIQTIEQIINDHMTSNG